jgi:hypothetical protein
MVNLSAKTVRRETGSVPTLQHHSFIFFKAKEENTKAEGGQRFSAHAKQMPWCKR